MDDLAFNEDFQRFVDAMLPAFMLEPAQDKARWPKDMRGDGGSAGAPEFNWAQMPEGYFKPISMKVAADPRIVQSAQCIAPSQWQQLYAAGSYASSNSLMSNALATAKWGG